MVIIHGIERNSAQGEHNNANAHLKKNSRARGGEEIMLRANVAKSSHNEMQTKQGGESSRYKPVSMTPCI